MLTDAISGRFGIDSLESDLAPYQLLAAHTSRGHSVLLKSDLKRAVPDTVLPERSRILLKIINGAAYDVVAELDDAIVVLSSWSSGSYVWVSAAVTATAKAIVAEVRGRMPEAPTEGRVDVCFTVGGGPNRYLKIDVRPWVEIRRLYPNDVQSALDRLMSHRPTATEARRMLVWRGPAGTGKTSAIRALLDAWSDWADGVVVTDPELFVGSGKYLRRTLLGEQDDDRWQVYVLEDAETLITRSAGADGISRLLNLSDGLLGQGLRCIFLMTTNQPLATINPAVIRPGRCLANVEFGVLSATEAAVILGRPVSRPMSLAEVMAGEPVSTVDDEIAVGQYL